MIDAIITPRHLKSIACKFKSYYYSNDQVHVVTFSPFKREKNQEFIITFTYTEDLSFVLDTWHVHVASSDTHRSQVLMLIASLNGNKNEQKWFNYAHALCTQLSQYIQ